MITSIEMTPEERKEQYDKNIATLNELGELLEECNELILSMRNLLGYLYDIPNHPSYNRLMKIYQAQYFKRTQSLFFKS